MLGVDLSQAASAEAVVLALTLSAGMVLVGGLKRLLDIWLGRLDRRWRKEDSADD